MYALYVCVCIYTGVNGTDLISLRIAVIEKSQEGNYSISYLSNENNDTIWPGQWITSQLLCGKTNIANFSSTDGIPPDGRLGEIIDSTHKATFIAALVLFGAFLIYALICLLFNIVFRKRRYMYNVNYSLFVDQVIVHTNIQDCEANKPCTECYYGLWCHCFRLLYSTIQYSNIHYWGPADYILHCESHHHNIATWAHSQVIAYVRYIWYGYIYTLISS